MGFDEFAFNIFVCIILTSIFLSSVLRFADTFIIIGNLNFLLLKIDQYKSILKRKLDLKPEVVHPNIKKTLLKQLGEDNFSIVVDKTPHFPYKQVFLSSNDIFHYYVLESEINNYVLGSKINIFFFYSSIWTF